MERDRLIVELVVHGEAQTAGSKKGFVNKKTGKVIITDDAKRSRPWKQQVSGTAYEAMAGVPAFDGAVDVEVTFYRARPAGHFGTGRNSQFVKDSAPAYPTTRPDVDKLSRAILDALTGIVYTDDARIRRKVAEKDFADIPYTVIRVFAAPFQSAVELPLHKRVRGGGDTPDVQQTLAA